MVKFGVAGYPLNYSKSKFKNNRLRIFEWLRSLDLDAFEAQMTYGPRTSIENCNEIKKQAADNGIVVSIHASYYIVLTSDDKNKVRRSIDTLKKTFELANEMGAETIVLHPGPYYSKSPEVIYDCLKENLHSFFNEIGDTNIGLYLETAGKRGQFGSVNEICEITDSFKGCYPCIDFGHVHARTGGTLSTKQEISSLFKTLEMKGVFKKKVHFHYTPIHYGPKGEITHKALTDFYPLDNQLSFFDSLNHKLYHPRPEPIIENIINYNKSFTVISETHNTQDLGAIRLKELYLQSKLSFTV